MGGPTATNQQASVCVSLLLVASPHHLATKDLRQLTAFLRNDHRESDIRLQLIDPRKNPELLELHKLVATPALVKLFPPPRQVFTGSTMLRQVRAWLPRWGQTERLNSLAMPVIPSPVEDDRDSLRVLELEDQLLVLRQENEALIARLQFQERQLRMVAHDLRTPMTTTSLALQSFERGQLSNGEFLDILGRRIHDMEQLSSELLEVGSTRWETLFNPQRLSLSQVSADVLLELEKMWSGRNLAMQTDVPRDLPDVFADSRRMRQVLLNLLENAFKFTPDGGQVKLSLMHRTSQWVQVGICDTGPGIPVDEQERIFQDQVRLSQTSWKTTGFGVGLSVCRRIVEAHTGKIWVVSELGKGSCFYFTVPVWHNQKLPSR
ncbi:MAG: histidine kinase [Synechococcus sp. SB0667_bin_8]|uniref:histidine kinase n=1 Tax=Synechococcus sp. SB0676_bin_10 TaxID=2604869 RepID=A0A6B1F8B5_9SYNE|nr:histidine kinase [Cyanobacteria bacterium MAG IRC3_bin_20]MDE0646900.1 histidine kinase [Cyanobacteria bacterium MAG IRC4_bin_6]MXX08277.1 histidine kinase [Synechococcus sp. SB0667_bin_8]MXY19278.1 histidine kinase [Synechococcus sp. SB0664_bin_36]MYG38407.1 histidine kinase [Synechococcus sp. SB0676_bin_10]MYG64299.1 histidine kinase [Synechococcus sp. SB0675_bin_7]MYK07718.1 histidine kinase [Synechococcus sp. SB0670_bin_20]MYK85449.1 histidine kinase [Synechococcus sp. SB0669_bin_7]